MKQAPRSWFNKLKTALLSWNFIVSTSDSSLFIRHSGKDVLFLLVYVDDILLSGNNSNLIQQTIAKLNSVFALKNLGNVGYFLGFEAYRDGTGLYLTQAK